MSDGDPGMASRSRKHIVDMGKRLLFLSGREISMIDEMLATVSPFGEVRLVVQKGRLRFVSSTTKHDINRSGTRVVDLEEQDTSKVGEL